MLNPSPPEIFVALISIPTSSLDLPSDPEQVYNLSAFQYHHMQQSTELSQPFLLIRNVMGLMN